MRANLARQSKGDIKITYNLYLYLQRKTLDCKRQIGPRLILRTSSKLRGEGIRSFCPTL